MSRKKAVLLGSQEFQEGSFCFLQAAFVRRGSLTNRPTRSRKSRQIPADNNLANTIELGSGTTGRATMFPITSVWLMPSDRPNHAGGAHFTEGKFDQSSIFPAFIAV